MIYPHFFMFMFQIKFKYISNLFHKVDFTNNIKKINQYKFKKL